jgi:2-keto-4-pentenoate hydratase/2-oxohepta-3-ene-1,7-dioic acid hydratase in catechol pathway
VTAQDFDLKGVRVQCRVNGETRQDGTLDDLLVRIEGIVSFISEIMTLMPGDVILTGTPMGVGELKDGDKVEVEVGGIGVLHSHVAAKI